MIFHLERSSEVEGLRKNMHLIFQLMLTHILYWNAVLSQDSRQYLCVGLCCLSNLLSLQPKETCKTLTSFMKRASYFLSFFFLPIATSLAIPHPALFYSCIGLTQSQLPVEANFSPFQPQIP